ncbi:MAG: transglutaminase domain-containing protein [Bacteroidaceae bacterium]|nr:transglutaminase domain-containing protein [Bacteroidaceae bacterium]
MKKTVLFALLTLFVTVGYGQSDVFYYYSNQFDVTRSSRTGFESLFIIAPCPQSNEYQDIYELDYTSAGDWIQNSIEENNNQFFELLLDETELEEYQQDFSVGYSFIQHPKTIRTDFSQFKEPTGQWKDLPDYDTTTVEYQENCKQSGEFIVPDNSTIQRISEEVYRDCYGSRLAYAEKCYEYVASHYQYLNPLTGIHPLETLLSWRGGDCGNLSSIYISLLRAKGIPARHVVAIGANNRYHIWAEFYIQGFGWVPVDVTYKNSNRNGNYFGNYSDNLVVVQKGIDMTYSTSVGMMYIDLLQTYCWWYSCYTDVDLSVEQVVTSKRINYSGVEDAMAESTNTPARKVIIDGRIYIKRGNSLWTVNGIKAF